MFALPVAGSSRQPVEGDQHARREVRVVVVGLVGEGEEGEPPARRELLVHGRVDRDAAKRVEVLEPDEREPRPHGGEAAREAGIEVEFVEAENRGRAPRVERFPRSTGGGSIQTMPSDSKVTGTRPAARSSV